MKPTAASAISIGGGPFGPIQAEVRLDRST